MSQIKRCQLDVIAILVVNSILVAQYAFGQSLDEFAESWADNCETMDPGNRTFQTGEFPYQLTLSQSSISCVQGVYATLRAPPPLTFQGFMVQARDNKTGEAVGEFDRQYDDVKVINCFARKDCTATHMNNSTKTEVVMRWAPEEEKEASITFFATVAETLDPLQKYWCSQRLATLHVTKAPKKFFN